MKIIISHDVDHMTAWEHNKDLVIPKFVARGFIEFGLGYISVSELMERLKSIFQNNWQNLQDHMEFDKENNIPSTFFISVANGAGLYYSLKDAIVWIKEILRKGFDVGVHGIAFNNLNDMKKEHAVFKRISGLGNFGIRIHYLRYDQESSKLLDEVGYTYDSSIYEMKNPFKVGRLWEFPLHIMDGYILNKKKGWQTRNLKETQEATKRIIEEALNKDIIYFSILFHDGHYSDMFKTLKEWYIWLIRHLRDNQFEFISYKEAVKELENMYEYPYQYSNSHDLKESSKVPGRIP